MLRGFKTACGNKGDYEGSKIWSWRGCRETSDDGKYSSYRSFIKAKPNISRFAYSFYCILLDLACSIEYLPLERYLTTSIVFKNNLSD